MKYSSTESWEPLESSWLAHKGHCGQMSPKTFRIRLTSHDFSGCVVTFASCSLMICNSLYILFCFVYLPFEAAQSFILSLAEVIINRLLLENTIKEDSLLVS